MEDGAASNLPENQPATWQADVIPEESHTFTISAQTWIGPLPDPVTMERYERLAPGAAERFLGMMEGEVIHRQVMDYRESRRQDWGLAAAFIVVVLIVAAGAGLIYMGTAGPAPLLLASTSLVWLRYSLPEAYAGAPVRYNLITRMT